MKQVKGYPPNYIQIKAILGEYKGTLYPYGDIIYNPTGKEIPEDIIIHEQVHQRQQKRFPTPEFWWMKYVTHHNHLL